MATAATERPTLETGDNLTREEFIRIWDRLPHIKRAELIGGIVYMPSVTSIDHADMDNKVGTWIGVYKAMTPGVNAGSNSSAFMLDDCPQPDVNLRIAPENGGQSWVENTYLHGAAELLVEVCNTTESIDLHQKSELYEEAGVQEYVVVVVKKKQILWHRLVKGKFKSIAADAAGVYRSRIFPGLWLDSRALFKDEMAKVLAKLHEGVASDEHQRFVADLAKRKK